MPCISREGRPLAKLGDDLVRVLDGLRNAVASRRKEDLADAIFVAAFGGVEPLEDGLDLFVAHADGILDLGLLEAAPGGLALDLPAQRADRGPAPLQIILELLGCHVHALGNPLDRAIDVLVGDGDLGLLGRLDLKRLVDQIAQHLLTQHIDLVRRNAALVGDREEREALIDIGLGDDRPVDDRGGLDDRRKGLAEDLRVFGEAKNAGAAARWSALVRRILGRGSGRNGQHECRRGKSGTSREEVECFRHVRKSLFVQTIGQMSIYSAPLNAGLAAEPFERHP